MARVNGLVGLLASYAVARGWRIGPWAALAPVIGTVAWVAIFIPGFLSMFQDAVIWTRYPQMSSRTATRAQPPRRPGCTAQTNLWGMRGMLGARA